MIARASVPLRGRQGSVTALTSRSIASLASADARRGLRLPGASPDTFYYFVFVQVPGRSSVWTPGDPHWRSWLFIMMMTISPMFLSPALRGTCPPSGPPTPSPVPPVRPTGPTDAVGPRLPRVVMRWRAIGGPQTNRPGQRLAAHTGLDPGSAASAGVLAEGTLESCRCCIRILLQDTYPREGRSVGRRDWLAEPNGCSLLASAYVLGYTYYR